MTIVEQLQEYCGCVDVEESDVVELINAVSSATGWAVTTCETFLNGPRTEYIDIDGCTDCPVEITPYYHPIDPETIKAQLVTISGLVETYTDIDFAYIESKNVIRIDTGLTGCNCGNDICGCGTEYKIKLTYDAGYDEIPDCLLPVFCNLLEVIHAKNKCDCGCGCGDNENGQDVTYATGDIVTVQLETDLGKMLVADYKRELGMISLLRKRRLWGVVV